MKYGAGGREIVIIRVSDNGGFEFTVLSHIPTTLG